jgi:predicted N-acetyltransferase YhbS
MQIEYLKDHTEYIPVIAKWFHQEWGHYYPELTIEDIEKGLHERTNKDMIPLTLVAVESDEVIGTVSLKNHDMDVRKQYTPWLASMYVRHDMRKKGVGAKLVEAVEDKAKDFGVKTLYLYTPDASEYYSQFSWRVLETVWYRGTKVTVMVKELQ